MFFSPNSRRQRGLQLQISERRLLLAAGDIGAVFLAVLFALFVWTRVAGYDFSLDFILSQSYWFPVLAGLWLLLASANDFYDLRVAASGRRTLRRLVLVTAQMIVVYVLVFFFSPRDALPRLFIFYYGVASFLLIGLWRLSRPFLLGWVGEKRRALVVGSGWSAETLIEAIQQEASNEYELRGIIGSAEEVGSTVGGVSVIGSGADLLNFAIRDRVSELIVTQTQQLSGDTFQGVMDAYERGIAIVPMPLLYERITGRVPVEHVDNDWAVVFLPIKNTDGMFDPYPMFKRILDIALSFVGLALYAPFFPLIALGLYIDSPGSIFFAQERLGRNGCVFKVYKLRTMIPNAEAATGAVFSRKGDPRITRVGRILRKTRLDEVPQLINVLRGDMSIVGPRPERPEHVVRLMTKIPFYRTRLIVRPGLTGWAQVRYQYGSDDNDALIKLQYDLYYIRHQSLLLDLNIMLRTVGKIVSLSGV